MRTKSFDPQYLLSGVRLPCQWETDIMCCLQSFYQRLRLWRRGPEVSVHLERNIMTKSQHKIQVEKKGKHITNVAEFNDSWKR